MSASDSFNEFYQKNAPRWFKVIRWREFGDRFIEKQKIAWRFFWLPLVWTYYQSDNRLTSAMIFHRPKNEEELEEMRRNNYDNVFHRNWEMGQYEKNMPPKYDLSERRKKYPEYYAGRYDGFKRDGDAVLPKKI